MAAEAVAAAAAVVVFGSFRLVSFAGLAVATELVAVAFVDHFRLSYVVGGVAADGVGVAAAAAAADIEVAGGEWASCYPVGLIGPA